MPGLTTCCAWLWLQLCRLRPVRYELPRPLNACRCDHLSNAQLLFRCCSFRDPVRYELGRRGLVVVTGQVHDTAEAGEWEHGCNAC